jgi:3-deoxy-7-phosphoheptulonate synthase
MSLILVWGAKTPIVRIARMAGQYAKPRSSPTETINGVVYNSFRGDNVNGMDLNDRSPDPKRLLDAYFHSAATLNYVRALLNSDFADLQHPEGWNLSSDYWNLDHVRNEQVKAQYQKVFCFAQYFRTEINIVDGRRVEKCDGVYESDWYG